MAFPTLTSVRLIYLTSCTLHVILIRVNKTSMMDMYNSDPCASPVAISIILFKAHTKESETATLSIPTRTMAHNAFLCPRETSRTNRSNVNIFYSNKSMIRFRNLLYGRARICSGAIC